MPGDFPRRSARLHRRAFFALLTVAILAGLWLLYPFVYPLLFACTTVVVCRPAYRMFASRLGTGRRSTAGLCTLAVGLGLVTPLIAVLLVISLQMAQLRDEAYELAAMVPSSEFVDSLAQVGFLPTTDLVVDSALPIVTSIPLVLLQFVFDVVIYFVAVLLLFAEGDRVLRVVLDLVPLRADYTARLVAGFEEIARNVVVGSLVTGVVQGVVASVGFWLAGVPHFGLFGLAVFMGSFVPGVGTLVAWLPVVVGLVLVDDLPSAGFVCAWNLCLTGTIDNVLRPLFVQGSLQLHPAVVFFAFLGGLFWLGLPGIIVGPLIAAGFMTLYRLYQVDHLGVARELVAPAPSLLRRLYPGRFPAEAAPKVPRVEECLDAL